MFVILIKDIKYRFAGKTVVIPKGTEVFINPDLQAAYYEGDSFDIFPDEYAPLN
jgi:hypothetical protein